MMNTEKAIYSISEVAKKLGLHEQTIRDYERHHLIKPHRLKNSRRVFTDHEVTRISLISTLTQEMGLNLAGVILVFKLAKKYKMVDDELFDFVIDHKNNF